MHPVALSRLFRFVSPYLVSIVHYLLYSSITRCQVLGFECELWHDLSRKILVFKNTRIKAAFKASTSFK